MVIPYYDSARPVLDEARVRSLESGASRLGADSDGLTAVQWLWDSSVSEARELHRLLALRPTAPRPGEVAAPRLASLIRILTRQIRIGQTLEIGDWQIWADQGRDDLDRPLVQWSIARTGGPSGVISKLTLLVTAGQSSDASWPLPFELLTLEDSDSAGRLVSTVIERDEDESVFVGSLTTRNGSPTGNPTDFGVVLRRQGAPEWTGGDAARSALESSAKSAAAAAALDEELRAAEMARIRADEARAALATAPVARSSATAARPKKSGARTRAARPRAITPEASANARGPLVTAATCGQCGATLVAGAAFCATCGAPARSAKPASQARSACAGCGANLTPGMAFCAKCGRAVSSTSAPVPRPSGGCSNCGAALKPGARFCRACGTAVTAVVAPADRMCAGCGNELAATARFCRRCGTPVQDVAR